MTAQQQPALHPYRADHADSLGRILKAISNIDIDTTAHDVKNTALRIIQQEILTGIGEQQ